MLVAHALLVDADALDGQDFLLVGQEARVQLVVGHDVEEDAPDQGGKQADDQEKELPGLDRDGVLCGPDGYAIGHEAAEDLAPAVETEPDAGPGALLLDGVPLGGEQGEAGGDGGLEDAQEEAHRHGAGEVVGGGHAAQDQAPHDDVEGGPLAEGQALQQAVGRVLPEEVAKVEHGGDPAVLLAVEAQVGLEAHDGGVGDGGLVEVVEAVDEAQERHQVPVDLAQEAALVVGGQLDGLAGLGLEDAQGVVGVVSIGMLEAEVARGLVGGLFKVGHGQAEMVVGSAYMVGRAVPFLYVSLLSDVVTAGWSPPLNPTLRCRSGSQSSMGTV